MFKKSCSKKGEEIVKMNYDAIDAGASGLIEVAVDPAWKNLEVVNKERISEDEYFDYYCNSIASLDGYDLPVSEFTKGGLLTGTMENNVSLREKRNIAVEVPTWNKDNCIQCGKCVMACPHSTIRAFLLTEEEVAKQTYENGCRIFGL